MNTFCRKLSNPGSQNRLLSGARGGRCRCEINRYDDVSGALQKCAAEGAVVELKLRLFAGKVPALRGYAHQRQLQSVETEVVNYFDSRWSAEEKATLRLCRELRNKVLHSDFRAARGKLNELGVDTPSAGIKQIDVSGLRITEVIEKICGLMAGTEGTSVSDTSSIAGRVFGWFLEAGGSGDFQKAADAFKRATAIIDKLIDIEESEVAK